MRFRCRASLAVRKSKSLAVHPYGNIVVIGRTGTDPKEKRKGRGCNQSRYGMYEWTPSTGEMEVHSNCSGVGQRGVTSAEAPMMSTGGWTSQAPSGGQRGQLRHFSSQSGGHLSPYGIRIFRASPPHRHTVWKGRTKWRTFREVRFPFSELFSRQWQARRPLWARWPYCAESGHLASHYAI